ncbi:hypothetical protein [Mycobacterium tuberculosis]|uniref:hypothetical protein n=1 Tax=Mycobacterium tuberculosis TaxID=1773 RepID=UPI00054CCFE1|nr:hypothetical protein [Mycobacterium tuberculosis]
MFLPTNAQYQLLVVGVSPWDTPSPSGRISWGSAWPHQARRAQTCQRVRRHWMIDTTEAAYRLTYQPDGTSITVRENLVDILARELLGPILGPQEVLPFSPRSQYLVGHLAPVKLTGAALIDDNAVQARANAEALAEGGGVPAYAADETTPTPTTTPKTAHPSRA